jgi:hypothetical protein
MPYLEKIMVLFPLLGPNVAMYATTNEPTRAPKILVMHESRNPSVKTAGPSMPSVILFAARLTENHMMATW